MTAARIAVGVSGQGSNLRALRESERWGTLGGSIVTVFADRTCPAVDWAIEQGIPVLLVPPSGHPDRVSWDMGLAAGLQQADVEMVVLAGFLRAIGPEVLRSFRARIVNVHPSLLPAFPGLHAIRDALAAGVTVTGVTVHLVDETLDGGPIVAQEAVPIVPTDDEASLAERLHAVEHRLLPRVVAMAAAGALGIDDAGRLTFDRAQAAHIPVPRRALLSMSDKDGLVDLALGLDALGFELVSTGGTASAIRAAGLSVTDVSAVTGWPEMLDGRVKTLHPRVHGGVLGDVRVAAHRGQMAHANIDPFQVVAVNLYPFADAAARPGIDVEALIEEIDIGGPALVRAAAKNHANVAILTDRRQYPGVLEELLRDGAVCAATRRELASAAFRLTAEYDTMIAAELARRFAGNGRSPAERRDADALRAAGAGGAPAEGRGPRPEGPQATTGACRQRQDPGAPRAAGGAAAPAEGTAPDVEERFPTRLDLALERAALLRYGENPHQAAALYLLPGADRLAGPLAAGARPMQGKTLSYNNLLDVSAAASLARDLRGAAVAIIKHGNPCGAAEAVDLVAAWERALAGDAASAFGGVVAVKGVVDRALAEHLGSMFLEVVVACAFDSDALRILTTRPDLRLLEDPGIVGLPAPSVEYRSAGGAVLATDADVSIDLPQTWRSATARPPTKWELADLEFAWCVCRHVRSNAVVLVRDRAVVGVGAGQMSRVDSARLAVEKAGPDRARGAACASDAFFPFPDGVEALAVAGVSAFVQPGGSVRDAEVIEVADRAGATMLLTGVRHFRH